MGRGGKRWGEVGEVGKVVEGVGRSTCQNLLNCCSSSSVMVVSCCLKRRGMLGRRVKRGEKWQAMKSSCSSLFFSHASMSERKVGLWVRESIGEIRTMSGRYLNLLVRIKG